MTASVYDPILIFAWYAAVPDKPPLEAIQQDVYDCFMGGFTLLGRIFNLNRKPDNRLAGSMNVWLQQKGKAVSFDTAGWQRKLYRYYEERTVK